MDVWYDQLMVICVDPWFVLSCQDVESLLIRHPVKAWLDVVLRKLESIQFLDHVIEVDLYFRFNRMRENERLLFAILLDGFNLLLKLCDLREVLINLKALPLDFYF